MALPASLEGWVWDVQWFPDGGKLLVTTVGAGGEADLWAVPALGEGSPQLLYRNAVMPAISPDGRSVAFTGLLLPSPGFQGIFVGDADGGSARKLVPARAKQDVYSPTWSPDGRWIAYLKAARTEGFDHDLVVEVQPSGGGVARTLVAGADLPRSSSICCVYAGAAELAWSPDWHLVFSASRHSAAPAGLTNEKYSLWEVPVDPRTGEAAGKPKQRAEWADYFPFEPAFSADGKQLSFLKKRYWDDVYLAKLKPGDNGLEQPRRFTLDNRGVASFGSWTLDSHAILFSAFRGGRIQIFQQGLGRSSPEPLVEAQDNVARGVPTPDGGWMLYREFARLAPNRATYSLMRRPVGGGTPQKVAELPSDADFWCAEKPGGGCVMSQREGNDIVFYTLDPMRGKGKLLGKIEASPSGTIWSWQLSPDGSRVAVAGLNKFPRRIEVLTLFSGKWQEISVEPGWGDLQTVAWTADGKGFFVTSWLPDSFNLLHVSPDGKATPLIRNGHRQFMSTPLPSPDGKYLAYRALTWDSNVWLIPNF